MSKLVDLLPQGSLPSEVLPSLAAIHQNGQIAQTSTNGSAFSVNQSTFTKANSEQQIKDRKFASQQIEKESMMLSPRQQ
ncbi:MAG: hypothetical protein ACYTXY_48940, partial [Nostoc sp.]